MSLEYKTIKIGHLAIGINHPVFIIAEIGNNHNGSYSKAIELVDLAVSAGADCVKFQMRRLDKVYRKNSLNKSGDDLGAEYTIDLLKRFELSVQEHKNVADYCKSKGVLYMCTPWDEESIKTLEEIGVLAYKVASADLTNIPLIEILVSTKKPLILSTGMSSEEEIKLTVDFLNSKQAEFVILHCNSTYPAPFQNINLKYIEKLREIHSLVGYSGHERGTAVTIAAIALNAVVIERHFTFDRQMEGPDHAASLEPKDFKFMVDGIRQVELARGHGKTKNISQGEMMNRESLAKSLIASRQLKKGTKITRSDISVKSPGRGLSPQYLEKLIGLEINRDMHEEEYFYPSDLRGETAKPRAYQFQRPWGIPIRYYDFDQFMAMTVPDLFEFHLSYGDMELDVSKYLTGTYDIEFVVHAPELFSGSHLMDLTSPEDSYRNQSLKETQKVIDITRELKKFFPKTKKPLIVTNIGGFSMDKPFSKTEKIKYYERFATSLKQLDTTGVEIIPQTMAPFPWHFGGQRYQNLFVEADEIVEICKSLNLRICLDVSHSRLTCNHLKIDFYDFVRKVGPFVAHLHMGDAKGVDGEGLQVGEGDIDFIKLANVLSETAPNASFIPEIWQGHKNAGEGFWVALERLEKNF